MRTCFELVTAPAGFLLQAASKRTEARKTTSIRVCISFDNTPISRTYESTKFENPIPLCEPVQPSGRSPAATLASPLLFLHGTEAAILVLRPDQFRERSDILISWRLAARDFFHLQGSDPIVGDALERHESALGQSSNISLGQEHACGFHPGAGGKNGCPFSGNAGNVAQMRNRGRVHFWT